MILLHFSAAVMCYGELLGLQFRSLGRSKNLPIFCHPTPKASAQLQEVWSKGLLNWRIRRRLINTIFYFFMENISLEYIVILTGAHTQAPGASFPRSTPSFRAMVSSQGQHIQAHPQWQPMSQGRKENQAKESLALLPWRSSLGPQCPDHEPSKQQWAPTHKVKPNRGGI
jgi:hypothetical protein